MSTPGQPDPLRTTLAELAGLGSDDDRAMLGGLRDRLDQGRLRAPGSTASCPPARTRSAR